MSKKGNNSELHKTIAIYMQIMIAYKHVVNDENACHAYKRKG